MIDEMKQLKEQLFNAIVIGLSLVGLGGGLLAVWIEGFASPWFLRSVALFGLALIAFALYKSGRFMMAAYFLILELIGIVVGMFLQTNLSNGLVAYLFIPLIIMAGFLLTPVAILATTFLAIGLTLGLMWLTEQWTAANLLWSSAEPPAAARPRCSTPCASTCRSASAS
jgi:hypothetical protein